MAHTPEAKAALRAAYVFEKSSMAQAAAAHDVPLSTARKWKTADRDNGDNWDKARAASSMTKGGAATVAQMVLSDFLTMYQETTEAIMEDADIAPLKKADALSRLADAFSKTMAAVAKAAPDLGHYAVATELLQDMALFIKTEFPGHAEAFAEILQPFAARVSEKYGS